MKKVSIKDVAKEAGVSLTTVSQVLNDKRDRFTTDTIEKVLAAKQKLGYLPNKNAQQLRGSKTKLIGVLLPNLANPFFSTMMQSIDANKEADVDLFFLTAPEEDIEAGIMHLVERGMDGLIIAQMIKNPERLNNYLTTHRIPYVVLDQSDDHGFTDIVRTHETGGGELAARHLIELGHKQLTIVQPAHLTSNMNLRMEGFKHYCQSHNVATPKVIESTLSKAGGYAAVDDIIASHSTAVFATNDEMAIGIIRGLADKGWQVPQDVSIVGFDDIDIAQYMTPALTTVAQPIETIGEVALQLIMDKLDSTLTHRDQQSIVLPSELIVRATTARANLDNS
ncbi:MAG TPA: LacI family transcriptional regulator [Staphylococcus arlettae]|nr:LacI family transcriptional regulator [Staphylococcus arlettae]